MANKYIHPSNCHPKSNVDDGNMSKSKNYKMPKDAKLEHEKHESMRDELMEYKGNVKVPK